MTSSRRNVTVGVDTHADTHTAAVTDHLGAVLGHRQFAADPQGYRSLLRWAQALGCVDIVGVEGTGSYGAGLTRYLAQRGLRVVEVDRPDRQARRARGKSDPADAEAAARAALSGRATGQPKTRDGVVESVRVLRLTRSSAVRARTLSANQLRNLIITAPEPLRSELRRLSLKQLVSTAARFRPGADVTDPSAGTRAALRSLARRHQQLGEEIQELDKLIEPLVSDGTRTACADRRRSRRSGGPAGLRRGQPRATHERSGVRRTGRRVTRSGQLRQESPAPAQSRRGPPGKLRALPHRLVPAAPRRAHARLCSTENARRPQQEGHHPLPQALRRSRGAPRPHRSPTSRTT